MASSRQIAPHFPSTRWSLIERARDPSTRVRHKALGEILRAYAGPLRAYLVLTKKFSRDRAEELVQDFLAVKLLEQSLAKRARRENGRFRTLLLRAMDRFVQNTIRDERAKKRWAGPAASLSKAGKISDGSPRPDEAFDVAWARQVLRQAIALMRTECERTGREKTWAIFEARVVEPTLRGAEPVAYEILAPKLGFSLAAEASNLLVTAKRMFARTLRTVVGAYLSDQAQIDREISELREILARVRR